MKVRLRPSFDGPRSERQHGRTPAPSLRHRLLLGCAAALLASLGDTGTVDGDPAGPTEAAFVVLKTGERDATQKKAGKFLADLGTYLAPRLGLGRLSGQITNKPADALTLIAKHRPIFGIVTPAFFLEHETKLAMAAVAESRRLGRDGEVFSVVTNKGAPPLAEGCAIATQLADERAWLERVVFPALDRPLPARPALKSVRNVADAVYDMTEGGPEAPAAVLLDRASLEFFREDPQVWPKLEVRGSTAVLPADLVVVFADGGRADRLWGVLAKMLEDEDGRRICKNLQTEGFAKVESARLEAARKRFREVGDGSK